MCGATLVPFTMDTLLQELNCIDRQKGTEEKNRASDRPVTLARIENVDQNLQGPSRDR